MNYIIFEDNKCRLLKPFIDLHPSFDLRVGIFTNIERISKIIHQNDTIQLYVRESVSSLIKNKYPNFDVNPEIFDSGTFLNGSALWSLNSLESIQSQYSYSNNNGLMAFSLDKTINIENVQDVIEEKSLVCSKIDVISIQYLWDIFDLLDSTIKIDSELLYRYKKGVLHPSATLIDEDNIIIHEGANISAGVILDASNGPIVLDRDCFIDIGALIKGPIYLGPNSKINPGSKIIGPVVIGPYSKVGGEIEDSVIQGFSNKQHDGFLGHSYIGEWVNLGANTNTSDLKNNYSNVKMNLSDEEVINTGKMFIGSIIGDFTKTAISTSLNTGTFIGTGSNVFSNSFNKKFIPPFSWGANEKVGLNRFLESCSKMMNRRKLDINEPLKERLIELYQK